MSAPAPDPVLPAGHPVPVSTGAGSSSGGAGSTAAGYLPWSAEAQLSSALGEIEAGTDWLKADESRGDLMLSAGSAGTSSTAASFSSAAELPLAEASLAPVAGLVAVRKDDVPRICVGSSVSAIRSSSLCRSVTTVGEAPPEPSDVFVRLSKPSSYDLTLTRLSLDMTPT